MALLGGLFGASLVFLLAVKNKALGEAKDDGFVSVKDVLPDDDPDKLLDEVLDDLTSVPKQRPNQFYDCCTIDDKCECEFGFKRKGFKDKPIDGSAGDVDRQVFVSIGKLATDWPENVDEIDIIKALKAVSKKIKSQKIKIVAIDDEQVIAGKFDIIVCPDMIRFTGLSLADVPKLESYFAQGTLPTGIVNEKLRGAHVFVCCHNSRDRRCGVCGPRLYKEFVEQAAAMRADLVLASASPVVCHRVSHIGGHKYAGNVIIYSKVKNGDTYNGDWYGYVDLTDVKPLIEKQIMQGKIITQIWRGRTGTSKKMAKKFAEFNN